MIGSLAIKCCYRITKLVELWRMIEADRTWMYSPHSSLILNFSAKNIAPVAVMVHMIDASAIYSDQNE